MNTFHIQNLTIHCSPEGISPIPVFLGTLGLSTTEQIAANIDPLPRFIKSEDGTTVTDTKTGLVWSQDKIGGKATYESAEKAVAECRLGGHADWRMPSREELESILDLERYSPAIDPAFACDTDYWYWTSTPLASSSGRVWVVGFGDGGVGYDHRDSDAFVRAVRSASPAGQ